MFKKISAKLILFIVLTGLIPLLSFSIYSIIKSRETSVTTVISGNRQIAKQMAGRIAQYLQNAQMILHSLSENINRYDLTIEQRTNVLRNFSINYDEFNYLRIIDKSGFVKMTSEISAPKESFLQTEEFIKAMSGQQFVSDVYMTEDMIPALTIATPIQTMNQVEGVLVARLDLLHLWKLVEELKIGQKGYLNILTKSGKIFATGDGSTKVAAIQMADYPNFVEAQSHLDRFFIRKSPLGKVLVVGSHVEPPYSWVVTVEQPTSEAYALSHILTRQLALVVTLFILFLFLVGLLLGKKVLIEPIRKLMARIQEIGQGKLEGKVHISGENEFALLGNTLNDMSHHLITIQDELVKKEKQALLGQIASGLAHDLKHPIASIENYTRLLEEKYDDPDYRQLFLRTVKREFEKTHVFLDNLTDYSKDIPFHPIKMSLNQVIEDVLSANKPELDKSKIELVKNTPEEITMAIDVFSFQRVLTNLIRNAKDAMPKGGKLTVTMHRTQEHIQIDIADTGTGIAPNQLESLFENFKSTKRNGLGLGLAIVHKIVKQHHGEIRVKSEMGKGTCFSLIF